jgi:hypothetical protein
MPEEKKKTGRKPIPKELHKRSRSVALTNEDVAFCLEHCGRTLSEAVQELIRMERQRRNGNA